MRSCQMYHDVNKRDVLPCRLYLLLVLYYHEFDVQDQLILGENQGLKNLIQKEYQKETTYHQFSIAPNQLTFDAFDQCNQFLLQANC
jgi:hypothetical protein